MKPSRLLVVPVVVIALSLTGCIRLPLPTPGADGTPSPSVSAIDPVVAEEAMAAALPTLPEDFTVVDQTGLDQPTFTSDWSYVDHDARRSARVLRAAESPGWADYARGPGYWIDVEIVLMESEDAAAAAYDEVADAVSRPYTLESDDGARASDYEPLAEPSGRWPAGTLEQSVAYSWSDGSRATGWIAYYAVGPFILVVSSAVLPGNDGATALQAQLDAIAPDLVEAVDGLPAQVRAR